jgi:methylmalonyl-CoA mutase N-terminal domain/subunit
MAPIEAAVRRLHTDASKGDRYNLMPAIIDAVKAYATAGEIIGVIRLARDLSYDPFDMIRCPFELS